MSSALRILIVDDSDVARRILATIVRSQHWDVCGEAEDGWSGVKKFHELKPDLVCWTWRCPTWMALKPLD
jgi:chemotaxis response regulator CheB